MMTKKRKIILAVALVLLICSIILYWKQGGFETPDVKELKVETRIINGKRFKGHNRELAPVIDTLRARNMALNSPKNFAIISFKEPSEDQMIDVFAGVFVDDSTVTLNDEYTFLVIPAKKYVRGHIFAHESFRNKIENYVMEFIEEKNITTTFGGAIHWVKYSNESIMHSYFELPVAEE